MKYACIGEPLIVSENVTGKPPKAPSLKPKYLRALTDKNGNMQVSHLPMQPPIFQYGSKRTAIPKWHPQPIMSQSMHQSSTAKLRLPTAGNSTRQHRNNPSHSNMSSGVPRNSGGSMRRRSAPYPTEPSAQDHNHSQLRFNTAFSHLIRRHPNGVPMPPTMARSSHQPAQQRSHKDASKLKISVCLGANQSISNQHYNQSSSSSSSCVRVDREQRQITIADTQPSTSHKSAMASNQKTFSFDAVSGPNDSLAETTSTALMDIIQGVLNGADTCLLCFGQSSTGKSDTIYGSDQMIGQLGLFPTAICWLYQMIDDMRAKRTDTRWSVRVSAVEVSGQQERLNDLLVHTARLDGQNAQINGEIGIEDDPIFGPQIMNVNEPRASSSERAANYLDAAMHFRNNKSSEEARNSHMFFTLHIYHYVVNNANTKVAGGRCRLHLVDLGSGEKSSRAGRNSLTFPAIGNVLTTILQGQKYMPFRDSKLTQVLRDTLCHQSVGCVSVVAFAVDDNNRQQETLNTLQIANRLYRIRRRPKTKPGSQHSSNEGSSANETLVSRFQRRMPRSASDPECTSSSEQSTAETVIFLGAAGRAMGRHKVSTSGHSDNDGESSVASGKGGRKSHPRMGTVKLPISGGSYGKETWIDGPKAVKEQNTQSTPTRTLASHPRNNGSTWVDGPSALPLAHHDSQKHGTKAKKSKPEDGLDQYKRDLINRWVSDVSVSPGTDMSHQPESPLSARGSLLNSPQSLGSTTSPPALPAPSGDASMRTSSDSSAAVQIESKEMAVQTDDMEMDNTLRQVTGAFGAHHFNADPQYFLDTDVHVLEDISEADEENLSMNNSVSRTSTNSAALQDNLGMPRNESLAGVRPIPLDLGSLAELDQMLTVSNDSHPLRSLSREVQHQKHSMSQQDAFDTMSVTSGDLDHFSCRASERGDDPEDDLPMDDDELERAMAASVSSVRSVDVLLQLKNEQKVQALKDEARQKEELELFGHQQTRVSQLDPGKKAITPPQPPVRHQWPCSTFIRQPSVKSSSITCSPMKSCLDSNKQSNQSSALKPVQLACCTASSTMGSSGSSAQSSAYHKSTMETSKPEKQIRPTIPSIPTSIRTEITSKLISAAAKAAGKRPALHTQTLPHQSSSSTLVGHHGVNEDQTLPSTSSTISRSVLQSAESATTQLPRHGWRRRSSHDNSTENSTKSACSTPRASNKKSLLLTAPETKSATNSPRHVNKQADGQQKQSKTSALMSFLKSPTSPTSVSARKTSSSTLKISSGAQTVNKRASSGYESGHEGSQTAPSTSKLAVPSPYSKLTQPRTVQRGDSSGHGSDSGTSGNGEHGASLIRSSRFGSLMLGRSNKSRNRESLSASSGYDSGGYGSREQDSDAILECRIPVMGTVNTFRPSKSFATQSQPQTPNATTSMMNLHHTADKSFLLNSCSSQQEHVMSIKRRQRSLKQQLGEAKDRLGIPDSKWSYELHVEKCMELGDAGLVEALEQETKILEKRVVACQDHVMMVTTFL